MNNDAYSTGHHAHQLSAAKKTLDLLLQREEEYWKEQSRIDWLSEGDRSKKFFYQKASARRSCMNRVDV